MKTCRYLRKSILISSFPLYSIIFSPVSNRGRREPEEDVPSLVSVQLIVDVLNGFARPVGGRSIAN
jgi:hypothetical protein